MDRRTYLKSVSGAALGAGLAGCVGGEPERGPVGEWADGTIEFGLPPFQDQEKLLEQYEGVFDWLAEGYDDVDEVEGVPTTSYSAVVESVVQGHTELANLSPVIFVLAESEGITPLVLNWSHGRDSYNSFVATRAETDVEELADVEGKTIAMVDPLSTSGGLFPRYMLSQAGLDAGDMETEPADFDVEWAFGHDAALKALEEGHVDVAAYGDFMHPDDESIEKVAESEPIPFDPMVAKPDTPDDVEGKLVERFLETPEEALADHRIDKFGEIEPGTYDPVREVAEEMGIEIEHLEDEE